MPHTVKIKNKGDASLYVPLLGREVPAGESFDIGADTLPERLDDAFVTTHRGQPRAWPTASWELITRGAGNRKAAGKSDGGTDDEPADAPTDGDTPDAPEEG